MRPLIVATAVVILTASAAACAAPINTETSVTYLAPVPPAVDTVGILPVSSGEGLEGFRRMISDSLYAVLRRERPEVVVLPADTTLDRINTAHLTDRYAQAIRDYQQTSVLDKGTIDSMGRAVGVKYFLYTRAAYAAAKSVSGNFLTGYSTRRDQGLQLFVHVWDTRRGDVVWEAVTDAEVSAAELQASRNLDEILGAGVRDLVGRWLSPRGQSGSLSQ
jgi:hypothetical protein